MTYEVHYGASMAACFNTGVKTLVEADVTCKRCLKVLPRVLATRRPAVGAHPECDACGTGVARYEVNGHKVCADCDDMATGGDYTAPRKKIPFTCYCATCRLEGVK